MANDNSRYGLGIALTSQLANMFKSYYDTNTQKDLTREELTERQRQFNENATFTKEVRDWTRNLTGQAQQRTEQELLVDTEVTRNPTKFGKGWRRSAEGKIEPYAYELSLEEQKKLSNQNNGSGGISSPRVIQSFQNPDGTIIIVKEDGTVETKGTPATTNTPIGYGIFQSPMALSWFSSPYKGLQTGNEPVFETTGGEQVNLKTGTYKQIVGKDALIAKTYPSTVNIQVPFNPYAVWTNAMIRKDLPTNSFNQQPNQNTGYWWEK